VNWGFVTPGTLKYPLITLVDTRSAVAIERMERVVATRASVDAGTAAVPDLEAGLADVAERPISTT
jgi:hypothetical protein